MDEIPMFEKYLQNLPLVAILRGITPPEVEEVGNCLFRRGFRVIEVPLNSPSPLQSIEKLSSCLGDEVLVGAGTVVRPEQVRDVRDAGGRVIVSPNMDPAVVEATVRAGLYSLPGVATPSEAFAGLAAGADALKIFPAESISPKVVKAWKAVLPGGTKLLPVGGINPENMADFIRAGACGFGLGSALYRAGMSAVDVDAKAVTFASAWQKLASVG